MTAPILSSFGRRLITLPDAASVRTAIGAGTGGDLATVADYGAVGTADDAATFQAAADSGEMVFVPAGDYAIGSDITPTDGAFLLAPNALVEGPNKILARGFYTTDQAGAAYAQQPNIWRFKDRLLVGDSADYNGAETKAIMTGVGPYSGSAYAMTESDILWLQRDASLQASSPEGMVAILGSSATSRRFGAFDTSRQRVAIGIAGIAYNDNAASAQSAWAGYFEGVVDHDNVLNTRGVYGQEIVVKDKRTGGGPEMHAYAGVGSMSLGTWYAAGGDATYGGSPGGPSSAAIAIGNNADTWHKGVVFVYEGLEGADGFTTTQRATAIEMALGHEIVWRNFNGGADAGSAGGRIRFTGVSGGGAGFGGLLFNIRSTDIVQSETESGAEAIVARFRSPTSDAPANYFVFDAVAAGTSRVVLSATGSDTNVGLILKPKGAENILLQDSAGANKLNINTTGIGFLSTNAVAAKTGWGVPTGTLTRTTFVTSTVTLPQLAERVAALIADFHQTAGYGLLRT